MIKIPSKYQRNRSIRESISERESLPFFRPPHQQQGDEEPKVLKKTMSHPPTAVTQNLGFKVGDSLIHVSRVSANNQSRSNNKCMQ
jgi:DNA-binding GntR family transcriptional regulator